MLEKLTQSFKVFMLAMGLNLNDPSLKDTPKRVAKMFFFETCRWLYVDPPEITTFPNNWYSGMVLVKDIEVKSLCEHHFQPFIWKCHIAYVPNKKLVWLSKFSRVVDHFSRKPQVQERLTIEIFDYLKEILQTDNIAVIINCEHFCMKIRWVEEPCSNTITSQLWWVFFDDEKTRSELYNIL